MIETQGCVSDNLKELYNKGTHNRVSVTGFQYNLDYEKC
jgi:hypothetical protein